MKEKIEKWAELLAMLKKIVSSAESININSNLYLLLLYFRIIDLSSDLRIAIQEGLFSSAPIITRSILESLVDFQNLVNNKSYCNQLDLDGFYSTLKMLKEYKANPDNPYLSMLKEVDIDTNIVELERKIKTIKDGGTISKKISGKFNDAKGKDVYDSVYNYLCQNTHGNIDNLKSKYLLINDGEVFIKYPNIENVENMYPYLDVNVRLLISTSKDIENIFTIFGQENIKCIEKYLKMLKDF
ncbi:MAG: DUF5677 domain-containing protein [Bacteroidales bacterium]|jgi:hypothetical protein